MTDKPRPPRPDGYPPPLPPRPLVDEPFPKAKSDPPLQHLHPLHDTPPPDARRRTHSTPPDGMPLPRRNQEVSQSGPLEDTIRELRLTNVLLREKLTAVSSLTSPSPVPGPPKSRAAVAGKVGINLGKYGTLVFGVLGLADVVVGLWFPEYLGPLGMVKRVIGIP